MKRVALALALFASCSRPAEEKAAPAPEPAPAPPAATPTTLTPPATTTPLVATPPAAPDAAPPATAAPATPATPSKLAGTFGFDWMHPTRTSCTAYDTLATKLAGVECEVREQGGFGGEYDGPSTACKLGKAEWLFFPSEKDCKTAFADMQANAP